MFNLFTFNKRQFNQELTPLPSSSSSSSRSSSSSATIAGVGSGPGSIEFYKKYFLQRKKLNIKFEINCPRIEAVIVKLQLLQQLHYCLIVFCNYYGQSF